MCGVNTNVITAIEIQEKDAGDAPQLPALVQTTRNSFTMKEVSAQNDFPCRPNGHCGKTPPVGGDVRCRKTPDLRHLADAEMVPAMSPPLGLFSAPASEIFDSGPC